MAEDNNFIPDDSELEFIKQEQDIALFNQGYDEPIDNKFLHNYIGGRQMGYGDDELKIIEDTAFSKIMDYMEANDIHYSDIDVYDFIPEDKRLTPYLIFELGQRNEYYTNDLVEYMISVTRRTPSGIYDFDLDEIIDAPPSHYMAEYALKGADAQGPEQKLITQAKIISGEFTEGDLKKLKFKEFFEKMSNTANAKDVKIKFVNNLFPGGSYEAYLDESQRRAMEKMGMTPEGDWLPEVKEKLILKSTDADGNVTYTDFYGKEVSPDDPRISDDSKFDDLVKDLQTPPEELTEEQQIKKLYDAGIISETEYKQALNKEGNWADTPTNVVGEGRLVWGSEEFIDAILDDMRASADLFEFDMEGDLDYLKRKQPEVAKLIEQGKIDIANHIEFIQTTRETLDRTDLPPGLDKYKAQDEILMFIESAQNQQMQQGTGKINGLTIPLLGVTDVQAQDPEFKKLLTQQFTDTPTNVVDDLAKQVDAQDIRIFFNEAYSKFDEKYMPWNYFENFLINEKKLSKDVAKEIISDIKTGLNKPEFLNFPDSILPSNIFPEAGNNFDTAVSQTLFRSPQVQRELSEKYIAVDTKDYLNLPLETQNELSSNFFEGINTQTTGNVEFYVQHQSINNIPANDIKQGFDMKFEIPGFYTEPIGNRQRNVIIGGGNNTTINNYYKVQANTENLLIDISKGTFVGTKSPLVGKTKNILGTQINKIDWDIFTKETGITFEMLGESAKIIDGKKYYSDSVQRFTQTLKAANTESNVWEALKKSGIEGFVTGPNNVQYEIVFLDPNDNSNTGKKLNIQDATIQEFQANQAKVNQIDELIIDTPTNVVDDGPALLESRMKLDTSTGPYKSLSDWSDDVIQPNKIYAPNKMETTKIGVMNSTFKSGEEVIEAINKGVATDEDITRFFIYVATQSPYEIYPTHQMFKQDAIADIVKIGIFSEIPLLELLPFNTQTANMNVRFTQTLVNNIHLKDIGIKQIYDMANEQGQFANLKERMRNNILDAHNKIYLENPNDYFILWRGGNLGRFSTWQSMSKSQSEASNVQYFMDEVSINKGRQTNNFVINKNNMIDLDALGLSYGTEKEVIVLTEAANKPGAKIPDLILDELDLEKYVESWIAKSTTEGRFPKQGYDIQNIIKQLNPLGQETQNFFNELISGMNPDLKPNKPYQQIIELNHPQLAEAQDIYNKYVLQGGDFNPHYYTSIPTVYEAQIVKAQALVNMFKDGNFVDSPFVSDRINILDIGGTEGTWSNTVAELGGNQFYVENLEPNPKANELYNAMETPTNSEIRNQAFSYLIDDQGKYFDKPSEVKFADFGAGGTPDKTTGLRNPNEFGSGRRYQVVHESMTFQFVDANRKAQIYFIADNLLTDDGILLIEEKFTNNDVIYQNNENMKDDFKRLYYTEEQINSKAQNIVGPMGDKQVSVQEIEKILGNRFKYVNQYWDSGNFKGYIASNNPLAETFVDEIHLLDTSLTNHGYSTAPTKEELKYAVQKDMRNRGINIELAKDVAKRFVDGNKQFIQSASDALGEVYKVGKAVAPAVGSLAIRGLSKAAPVLAPGDVLVEGALSKVTPYVDDFAKRLGFASLPAASLINAYVAAEPQQPSQFQESLTKFLLPKAYEEEAVQRSQIPQDLESFYRTPAGQQFLKDNDFGSLFKKQLEQEKLTKYSPGWQLSKAIFSLFGRASTEQSKINEKNRGNMGQALLTGIGK